jgi:hypothetical protein
MNGGRGEVFYERVLGPSAYFGNWAFVDHYVLAGGATLGSHVHKGTEEIYYVMNGEAPSRWAARLRNSALGTLYRSGSTRYTLSRTPAHGTSNSWSSVSRSKKASSTAKTSRNELVRFQDDFRMSRRSYT